MRKWYLFAVMASTVTFIAACAPSLPGDGSGAPQQGTSASAAPPMSPSDLPTISSATAPPTAPTDSRPKGILAGVVTALTEACTDVTTDDGVVWSLSGDRDVALAVGDTVRVKIAELEPGEKVCGPGSPARMVSVTVVA